MASNQYLHPLNLNSNDRQLAKENGITSTKQDRDPDYVIHSSTHSGQISVNSPHYDLASHKSMAQAEKTRRSARARKPMSYLIPAYLPDDDPVEPSDNHIAKPIPKNPPPHATPENEPQIKRLRMNISRDHPVPLPPPLPTIPSRYLQGDRVPPWLMDATIVKASNLNPTSSPNSTLHHHPHDGPGSHQLSSPSRPTSPSKLMIIHRPSHSLPSLAGSSSTASSEQREEDREKYWARYDYNFSAPHLQPRYYGSSASPSERWVDLDTQNPTAISESTVTSFAHPLFDVFSPPQSTLTDNEALELASRLKKSVPFGFEVGLQVYASEL
ncbi:hypothetical protein DFH28DRAFT_978299 [Melampsora americana]|nr:hypothetical protein DFH28DRAFT_978299 [Melampsora americana]